MTMLDITLLEQHMQILTGLLPDATSPEAAAYPVWIVGYR